MKSGKRIRQQLKSIDQFCSNCRAATGKSSSRLLAVLYYLRLGLVITVITGSAYYFGIFLYSVPEKMFPDSWAEGKEFVNENTFPNIVYPGDSVTLVLISKDELKSVAWYGQNLSVKVRPITFADGISIDWQPIHITTDESKYPATIKFRESPPRDEQMVWIRFKLPMDKRFNRQTLYLNVKLDVVCAYIGDPGPGYRTIRHKVNRQFSFMVWDNSKRNTYGFYSILEIPFRGIGWLLIKSPKIVAVIAILFLVLTPIFMYLDRNNK